MATDRAPDEIALAIFTRAPIAGATKTRLIPRLGAEGAARLHEHLIRHALATARAANIGPLTLWCAPDASDAFLARCAEEFGASVHAQPAGDLGARMNAAFEARAPLLLMGSDAPVIDAAMLRDCAAALRDGEDAVFLPAEDGGYALVGLARPAPRLFRDMIWSTDTVMAETRRRLLTHKLRWREPATIWDVDRSEDVDRLLASGLLPDWKPSVA